MSYGDGRDWDEEIIQIRKTAAIQTLIHRHSQPKKNSSRHTKRVEFIMQQL